MMVNQNFDKFRKTQSKHTSVYVGSDQVNNRKEIDGSFNGQSNTDESVGAKGRSNEKK